MCPVIGASVNEDDVRIAAASAGGEAFAEAVVPPGLACVPLEEVLLGGVGDRRTGEGNVDIQLRILQVVIDQSPPIGLAWKGEASVRGRVMCRIVARDKALEGRDGVADDTDAFLGRLLCVRVGREPFDARIAVLSRNPYGAVGTRLQLGQQGAVRHLGGAQLFQSAGRGIVTGVNRTHRTLAVAVADRSRLGAAYGHCRIPEFLIGRRIAAYAEICQAVCRVAVFDYGVSLIVLVGADAAEHRVHIVAVGRLYESRKREAALQRIRQITVRPANDASGYWIFVAVASGCGNMVTYAAAVIYAYAFVGCRAAQDQVLVGAGA